MSKHHINLDSLAAEINALPQDAVFKKDVTPHTVGITKPEPHPVGRFMESFQRKQEHTVKVTLELAEWLENTALDLRNRAAIIGASAVQIPEDIRRSVDFDIETENYVKFLGALRKDE